MSINKLLSITLLKEIGEKENQKQTIYFIDCYNILIYVLWKRNKTKYM